MTDFIHFIKIPFENIINGLFIRKIKLINDKNIAHIYEKKNQIGITLE